MKSPVSFRHDQICAPLSELPPLNNLSNTKYKNQQKKLNPPSIVIPQLPQWKKISRINTPQTAMKFDTDTIFSSNINKNILHPLTPHVHLAAELGPLIKRCLQFMDYPYVSQSGDLIDFFNANPDNPIIKKKTDTLNSILKYTTDPISRNATPSTALEYLFDMIEKHIFRPIPIFPPPNDFSEVAQFWIVKNWSHVQMVHKILQCLLNDQKIFSTLLNDEFVYNLINQLCTPDSNERKEIETELKIIIKTFTNKRGYILRSILSKTIAYLDGDEFLADSVGSYLQLFLEFFSSQPIIKPRYFLMFRTVFYPLYSTNLAPHFELPLQKLSSFFQSRDPKTAAWCLFYLKKHWPITSTKKQVMFLNQFLSLLPSIPMDIIENSKNVIVQIIISCIRSESYIISSKTMLICSDLNFLSIFSPQFLEKIANAVENSINLWKKGQKELSENLLKTINSILENYQRPPQKNLIDKSFQWEIIINAAAANNNGIIIENEMKKLETLV